jgi:hypothetical protein
MSAPILPSDWWVGNGIANQMLHDGAIFHDLLGCVYWIVLIPAWAFAVEWPILYAFPNSESSGCGCRCCRREINQRVFQYGCLTSTSKTWANAHPTSIPYVRLSAEGFMLVNAFR